MIEKVDELKNVQKKELFIQKEEMEMILNGIKTTTEFSRILIENGTNIEIGMSQKQILARFNTLINLPFSHESIHS